MPTQEELDALAQQHPGLKKYQVKSGGKIEKKTGGGGEKAFQRMIQNKKQGGNDDFLGTDKHQTEMLDLDNKNGHPLGDFGGKHKLPAGAISERPTSSDPNSPFYDGDDQGPPDGGSAIETKGTDGVMQDPLDPGFGEKFSAKQPGQESMDTSGFGGSTSQGSTRNTVSEKPPVSRKQARQDRRKVKRNRRSQRRAGRK